MALLMAFRWRPVPAMPPPIAILLRHAILPSRKAATAAIIPAAIVISSHSPIINAPIPILLDILVLLQWIACMGTTHRLAMGLAMRRLQLPLLNDFVSLIDPAEDINA